MSSATSFSPTHSISGETKKSALLNQAKNNRPPLTNHLPHSPPKLGALHRGLGVSWVFRRRVVLSDAVGASLCCTFYQLQESLIELVEMRVLVVGPLLGVKLLLRR